MSRSTNKLSDNAMARNMARCKVDKKHQGDLDGIRVTSAKHDNPMPKSKKRKDVNGNSEDEKSANKKMKLENKEDEIIELERYEDPCSDAIILKEVETIDDDSDVEVEDEEYDEDEEDDSDVEEVARGEQVKAQSKFDDDDEDDESGLEDYDEEEEDEEELLDSDDSDYYGEAPGCLGA